MLAWVLRMDAVSIYDMDWSHPTAIVVGNENRYRDNRHVSMGAEEWMRSPFTTWIGHTQLQ
uniref:Uncharacterized protein n=1 Tax=Fagus sylvatica TaxID=28930 RepID=A0A2N9IAH9_FAGSY